jgi:hypothetical protein
VIGTAHTRPAATATAAVELWLRLRCVTEFVGHLEQAEGIGPGGILAEMEGQALGLVQPRVLRDLPELVNELSTSHTHRTAADTAPVSGSERDVGDERIDCCCC